LPKASVVVATIYRRVDLLDRAVKSLLDLDYPDYEIIVVDNRVGSGHTPIPEFSDDGRVRIVAEGTPGVSAARNRGVAESRGEFIAFTDDDVEVEPNWLRELASKIHPASGS
jgi:glycosyltransferase involved in cell wall biosynthesis